MKTGAKDNHIETNRLAPRIYPVGTASIIIDLDSLVFAPLAQSSHVGPKLTQAAQSAIGRGPYGGVAYK
jgi:hypothetical protein